MKFLNEPDINIIELRLYIAGESPNSLRAVANLKAICEDCLPGQHRLEVVDILDDAMRPIADGILVTPTLLKVAPMPLQRIIGDLNDRSQVLLALGMKDSTS